MTTQIYEQEVAKTILSQIHLGAKMRLGFHEPMLASRVDAWGVKECGVTFKVKVLPFTKAGARSHSPRIMRMFIYLNGMDYYDITLGYQNKDGWVEHFSATNVDCFQLTPLLLALDYDGQDALNPAILAEV